MSVCLRKLPKIGLSVVPAFAYIPPLRSGTAAPPLLSLPYVRFICFAVVYAKLNRIYSTFLLYRKYRLLSETQRFFDMKTRILFVLFFKKQTSFDFYDETAASAIRIVLYSIPSGETASHSLSLPLTVIFCPGSTPETFALSNSSPWAQHARTSVIMQ